MISFYNCGTCSVMMMLCTGKELSLLMLLSFAAVVFLFLRNCFVTGVSNVCPCVGQKNSNESKW